MPKTASGGYDYDLAARELQLGGLMEVTVWEYARKLYANCFIKAPGAGSYRIEAVTAGRLIKRGAVVCVDLRADARAATYAWKGGAAS